MPGKGKAVRRRWRRRTATVSAENRFGLPDGTAPKAPAETGRIEECGERATLSFLLLEHTHPTFALGYARAGERACIAEQEEAKSTRVPSHAISFLYGSNLWTHKGTTGRSHVRGISLPRGDWACKAVWRLLALC
jgi:hypothetical protein